MTTSEPGTTDARGLDPSLQHAQRLISESASARPGTAHGNESLRCNLLGRALEALQLKPDAAQQAEAQQAPSAALRGARAMLDQLLGQVAEPQPELFSSPGGEPMEPLAQQRPAGEHGALLLTLACMPPQPPACRRMHHARLCSHQPTPTLCTAALQRRNTSMPPPCKPACWRACCRWRAPCSWRVRQQRVAAGRVRAMSTPQEGAARRDRGGSSRRRLWWASLR